LAFGQSSDERYVVQPLSSSSSTDTAPNLAMGDLGREHDVKHMWAYMLFGQLVTTNLFFLALTPPGSTTTKKNSAVPRRATDTVFGAVLPPARLLSLELACHACTRAHSAHSTSSYRWVPAYPHANAVLAHRAHGCSHPGSYMRSEVRASIPMGCGKDDSQLFSGTLGSRDSDLSVYLRHCTL
jgi:hypothetical protein